MRINFQGFNNFLLQFPSLSSIFSIIIMCLLFLQYLYKSVLNSLHTSKEDLFRNLPQETTIDILSRLPIETIMSCKFVCKSWRDLVECSEFATLHLSKSSSSSSSPYLLADIQDNDSSKPYKICAFDDCSSRVVAHFGCFLPESLGLNLLSSANGLLLLVEKAGTLYRSLFICNPVTREYMKLPSPWFGDYWMVKLGFGESKVSGQYKVVCIFNEYHHPYKCQVYTLGTGLWRSTNAVAADLKLLRDDSVSLNGNLHWLSSDLEGIRCFDLETELFTYFPGPRHGRTRRDLCVLEDRLCLCDNPKNYGEINICIWSMNIYGDGNSWTKELIIITSPPPSPCSHGYHNIFPVKVAKDGIVLAVPGCANLHFYSKKTKGVHIYSLLDRPCSHFRHRINIFDYTPTFFSTFKP